VNAILGADAVIGFAQSWPGWAEKAGIYSLAHELQSEIDRGAWGRDGERSARIGRILGLAEARLEAAVAKESSAGTEPSMEGMATMMSMLSSAVWICVLVL